MSIVFAANPQEEMKAFIQMFEFRKGVSTPCPPPHPFLKSSPPFVKIAHSPHPQPYWLIGHPKFSLLTEMKL